MSDEQVTADQLRQSAAFLRGFVDGHPANADRLFLAVNRLDAAADCIDTLQRELTKGEAAHCYGSCGWLGWTFEQYGRVVHKHACPRRGADYCQTHPDGCDSNPWRDSRPSQALTSDNTEDA